MAENLEAMTSEVEGVRRVSIPLWQEKTGKGNVYWQSTGDRNWVTAELDGETEGLWLLDFHQEDLQGYRIDTEGSHRYEVHSVKVTRKPGGGLKYGYDPANRSLLGCFGPTTQTPQGWSAKGWFFHDGVMCEAVLFLDGPDLVARRKLASATPQTVVAGRIVYQPPKDAVQKRRANRPAMGSALSPVSEGPPLGEPPVGLPAQVKKPAGEETVPPSSKPGTVGANEAVKEAVKEEAAGGNGLEDLTRLIKQMMASNLELKAEIAGIKAQVQGFKEPPDEEQGTREGTIPF